MEAFSALLAFGWRVYRSTVFDVAFMSACIIAKQTLGRQAN